MSKLGLAFVAWTRSTSWQKMAFHKLPPMEEFVAARLTREFEARSTFEQKADSMFAHMLERRGVSPEALLRAHEEHQTAGLQAQEHRVPSDAELADLRSMLATEGVAPVSDSVKQYCSQKTGRKEGGLWSFVASFRAEKSLSAKGKRKASGARAAAGPAKRPRANEQSAQSQLGSSASTSSTGAAVSDDSAAQSMREMGFAVKDITHALETTSFSFTRALRLLLNGLDAQRMKSDAQERFRRHGLKVVKSIKCEDLARPSVTAQYAARARELYDVDVEVLDLGQMCLCC